MCLIVKKKTSSKLASRDITCYKVVLYNHKGGEYVSPVTDTKISKEIITGEELYEAIDSNITVLREVLGLRTHNTVGYGYIHTFRTLDIAKKIYT